MKVDKSIRQLTAQQWIDYLCRRHEKGEDDDFLPTLPTEDQQRRFVGKAYRDAFSQGVHAFSQFVEGARQFGLDVNPRTKMLDFGCGWGRMSQIAFWKIDPENIESVDVQQDAVDLCRAAKLHTNITKIDMLPPIDLADNSIDFIIAYSVFSHLNEEIHLAWIEEFRRLLKPGGILAVTTRSKTIINHARNLARSDVIPPHARGLAEAFADWKQAAQDYDNGKFVFRAYPGNTKVGGGYGEACIPAQYAERRWKTWFDNIKFIPDDAKGDQAIIIAG